MSRRIHLNGAKHTKAQIIGEVAESKGIFNIEHEHEGNTEEVEFQFKLER